jgi:glycosyltransferase involved in cell wall biosynthesis
VDWLLRAFAKTLADVPGAQLRIIGDGPERNSLHQLTRSLGIESQTTFTGALPPDDVFRHLQESRVLVIPSVTFENNPLSGLEALQAGTPIIGNRIGGIPELIEEGRTGNVVDIFDTAHLSEKLTRILIDDQGWIKWSQRSKQLFAETFTPQIHVARLQAAYQQFIHAKA